MKAFLKGGDGAYFPLSPKVTTIGRENCDFIIQTTGVDHQHAVIEYNEQEDSFVLQDLNSAQGTYVNEVRVQNAAVRLAPGDIIRLGYGGTPYELHLDSQPQQLMYPPVSRPAWTQPITILSTANQTPFPQSQQMSTGLPFLSRTSNASTPPTAWQPVQTPVATPAHIPRPPLRTRPLSAGANKRTTMERVPSYGNATTDSINYSTQRSVVGGWTVGPGPVGNQRSPQTVNLSHMTENAYAEENEQKISCLSEEVKRLQIIEMDAFRKDQHIQLLSQEINDLKLNLQKSETTQMGDPELTQKLLMLEAEVTAKKNEVVDLKNQLAQLKSEPTEGPAKLREELADKVKELNTVKNELERIKKDKTYTNGLVTSMQRDMSNKPALPDRNRQDISISKITREIESLKKEVKEKDVQLASLSAKVNKINAPKPEEKDAREKELISLRQKFKTAENKVHEQQQLVTKLKEELDSSKKQLGEERDLQKKMLNDIEEAKSQYSDVRRTEQVVRCDLEKSAKKMETFRNRIIEVTYSSPSLKKPETMLGDDELVSTLKQLVEERTSFVKKIKQLEDEMTHIKSNRDDLSTVMGQLRFQAEQSQKRLDDGGRLCSSLIREINMLKSVVVDESITWIKDFYLEFLNSELRWEEEIETALNSCGVNLKLSNEGPGVHIGMLLKKWETSSLTIEQLKAEMNRLTEQHATDLESMKASHLQEMEGRINEAVEKTKLTSEKHLNEALDRVCAVETEKRENAVEAERKRVYELQEVVQQLQESITSKSDETEDRLKEASDVLSELQEYKAREMQLKEDVEKMQKSTTDELEKLRNDYHDKDKLYETELIEHKEQNKQHAVTICKMEETLTKLTKRNKEYADEISTLKDIIHELKAKPLPPPKPKIVVQKPTEELAALEQVICTLRAENVELKRQIQDEQNVIIGLRKDLAGASARLSDISGEMSETKKREMEMSKEKLVQRDSEVTEARQQLVKLSTIVDKQKEELAALKSDLSVEKELSSKLKSGSDDKMQRIEELELRLSEEKEEQKKQLVLLDQEGRITSELSALGQQCRGERHEQVISRQREALSELRSRVKTLEVARPPLPSQDQALQQVILLKKELAEMRANQALADSNVLQNSSSLDRELGMARGLISSHNHEADMERSAHRETMEALELSEQSFMRLLREAASTVDLDDIMGLSPMAHIPRDEREKLLVEREKAAELLASRIRVFKEQVKRKDELLQGYEIDLAKLRQAQELSERKALQLEDLTDHISTRTEESHYLRESLNRTRDKLDQEKRLNKAIKQKKTFHLENERAHIPASPHRCRIDDPKSAIKKRAQRELLKRKNYEINTLKSELCRRERSLSERDRRLHTLQSSLSAENPRKLVQA